MNIRGETLSQFTDSANCPSTLRLFFHGCHQCYHGRQFYYQRPFCVQMMASRLTAH